MSKLDFMIMGDKAFFHTMDHSVDQIRRFYPDSRIFIYDWGFTDSQLADLRRKNSMIVTWEAEPNHPDLKTFSRVYLSLIKSNPLWFLRQPIPRLRRNMRIFTQKPACILDCVRRSRGNLVFLDADAFLIDRIDEVFGDDFHVGVTLRRQHEIRLPERDGECSALNVGVMFFKGSLAVLEAFIQRWKEEVAVTRDYCIEQTALSNIVATTREDIYDGFDKTGVLAAGGEKIKIKVYPCETYNYNWIEEGFDRRKNKILHFKGGRHGKKYFDDFIERTKSNEPA